MKSNRPKSAFLALRHHIDYVYGEDRIRAIDQRTEFVASDPYFDMERLTLGEVDTCGVEVLFSTWGLAPLNAEQVERFFPSVRAVFYAAGTVGHFAGPYLDRGVTIVSAWRANAVPVAEFTLAHILLSLKGYHRNLRDYDGSKPGFDRAYRGPGAYGETVALLGAGAIGRILIDLLRPFSVKVILWDPFVSKAEAASLGVEKVDSLAEAFERGLVVSNHLADKPETEKLITGELIAAMRANGVLINTGRGRTIDENAMVEVLGRRCDLTALLDVTHPEPPGRDSCLMAMPNIHVTSHIAGSIGDEVHRMADLVIEEFDRYIVGAPLRHQITPDAFRVLA